MSMPIEPKSDSPTSEISSKEWKKQSQSYRRGYIEGDAGQRNIYLLEAGTTDIVEYNRGFEDGSKNREKYLD